VSPFTVTSDITPGLIWKKALKDPGKLGKVIAGLLRWVHANGTLHISKESISLTFACETATKTENLEEGIFAAKNIILRGLTEGEDVQASVNGNSDSWNKKTEILEKELTEALTRALTKASKMPMFTGTIDCVPGWENKRLAAAVHENQCTREVTFTEEEVFRIKSNLRLLLNLLPAPYFSHPLLVEICKIMDTKTL